MHWKAWIHAMYFGALVFVGPVGCGGDEDFYDDNQNEVDDREEGIERPGIAESALTAGGGRVSGLYCGDGLNGHNRGSLYRYTSASQTFALESVCANGCGINGPGVNDACVPSPSALETSLANRARNAVGASAPSVIAGNAALGGSSWQTDISGGDGAAMRLSIGDYHAWNGSRNAAGAPTHANPPAAVLTSMKGRLTNYNATDRTTITNRIIAVYSGSVPATDQATLTYLGIRAQCKETVDRWVQASGGTSRSYASYIGRNVGAGRYASYTVGKGVIVGASTHAAVVTAVSRDANGRLLSIQLAESNWGTGFSNPTGQIPWSRVVALRTVQAPLPANYTVFSF